MRFSAVLFASLAAMAMASSAPNPASNAGICARNTAETDLIAESIIFGVESAKCKILKCAKIVATGACILSSLPDVTTTLACVGGNAEEVRSVQITCEE